MTPVHPLHIVRRGAAPLYYSALRAFGVIAASRRLRDGGLILCYHNVVPTDGDPLGGPGLHMPCARFEKQMRWLSDHYEVVPLKEMIGRMTAGASLRAMAAVTFDDAYAGVFEHALPILEALEIPATVFVVAEAIGRTAGFWWDRPELVQSETPARRETWLTAQRGDGEAILSADGCTGHRNAPAALRTADEATLRSALRRGMDLGVHSATHRSLPTLTDAELEYELVTSRSMVHRATGVWPELFAYPYGRWDARVRARVRDAGYRAALTLDAGLNDASSDLLALRRINVPAGISSAAFEAWTAGLQARGRPG